MKISLLHRSKQSSRLQQSNLQVFDAEFDDQDNESSFVRTEYVTEFDPSKTLAGPKKIIIPPKPNEWGPNKRMKNLKFETDSAVSYGLNLRQFDNTEPESDQRVYERPVSIDGLTLKNLRDDINRLPDDQGFEEFNNVPVEGLGAALLAGYGWYEGRGIGKNHTKDVKVVEFKRRNAKQGLGFVFTATSQQSPPKVVVSHNEKDEILLAGKEEKCLTKRLTELGLITELNQ